MAATSTPWWRDAVFYQVYVRSFCDGDGDGSGDLAGLRSRLPYLAGLGVDALWLTPFYPSPQADGGYDVADPRDVDPLYGKLSDLDAVVADAHGLGLRVTIDIVPNHSSDQHPWFQAALAAPAGSAERERYVFRDGRGPDGAEPPNNWWSQFGGGAWSRVPDGQWYLHMFAPEQPDLNWRNPAVREDYEGTLRFWLDRGVDGFRIDVAAGLVKDEQLRDNPGVQDLAVFGHGPEDVFAWDRPEVHDVYRGWRRVVDGYPGDRVLVGEVWLRDDAALARYVRADELHLAFNFKPVRAPWSAAAFRDVVDRSVAAMASVGAPPTWVLSNHDIVRHVTRFGDGEVGRARARAALLLLLALPGPAFVYQGEELGLPEVSDLPDAVLQDPIFRRTGGTRRGRDGCRVPLPWSGAEPPYGFSPPGTRTWLPQPGDWAPLTAQAQDGDPGSVLELYRRALRTRRETADLRTSSLEWLEGAAPDVLAFRRGRLTCAVNMGETPVRRPPGAVVLASAPAAEGDVLTAGSAVWVRRV
jgi:alpha-glucosidase